MPKHTYGNPESFRYFYMREFDHVILPKSEYNDLLDRSENLKEIE